MADKKISALPAATTPLAGSEVLPIVQGGTTDKVSVANLTAGRDVSVKDLNASGNLFSKGTAAFFGDGADNSAYVYATGGPVHICANAAATFDFTTAGNLKPLTAGKGIDFSANTNAPGMTSEVLTWYEEGAFTPVVEGSTSAGTATYTAQLGSYTRVGRLVHFQIYLSWSAGTGTGGLYVSGLPFVSGSSNLAYGGAYAPVFFDVALAANNYCSGAYIPAGGTTMRFYQNPIGGGAATVVDYDAAGEVMIVGQYFV